jgi:hypothetical protein
MVAHRSCLADSTGCGWLMLAAAMAGLADGGWRSSPDPAATGRACRSRIATLTRGADPGSVRAARDCTAATAAPGPVPEQARQRPVPEPRSLAEPARVNYRGARPRHPRASRRAQFRSHSPPSGAIHRRTRTAFLPRPGTPAAGGGWPGAVLESVRRGSRPWLRVLSQFLSHSSPSGAVHPRPHQSCSGRTQTVASDGERRSALLESVLGATPREFESRILRHPDLRKRTLRATGRLLAHRHLAQFVATTRRCPGRCAWSEAGLRPCLQYRFPGRAGGQPSAVSNPASPVPRAGWRYPQVAAGWPP